MPATTAGLVELEETPPGEEISLGRREETPGLEGWRRKALMLARTEAIAKVGSWEWEIATDEVRWSEELFRIMGRDPGKPAPGYAEHDQLFPPEDLAREQEAVARCRSLGIPYEVEMRAVRPDGTVRQVIARGRAERDEEGRIVRLAGSLQDVTEQREAMAQIATMSAMLDAAPTAITVHDEAGHFLYANEATVRVHGYASREEFLQVNLDQLDVPETEALLEARMEMLRKEGVARFEVEHFRKDGSRFPLEVLAKKVDWMGPAAFMSVATDISSRKEAERVLQEKEERFRALFEKSPMGVAYHRMIYDDAGRPVDFLFLEANSHYMELTGVDPRGRRVTEAFPGIEKDPFDWIGTFARVAREGETVRVERHLELNDRWYDLVAFQTERDHFVAAFLEITEQKRLVERLAQAQRLESVGRLAGGVAHDFNNMLSVILGYADMALSKLPPGHPNRADFEGIRGAVDRATDLTRQLLAFARQQPVKRRVLCLNEAVESMLKMLRRLIGEDILLDWRPGWNLRGVLMDPAQIDQVLANLVVNARDAIDGVGEIRIGTRMERLPVKREDAGGGSERRDFVILEVGDNGCGMDEETRRRVFEPFFTTKAMGKGTGLGLATVYGIVRQNEGCIEVESEPGKGTTFRIFFPAVEPSEEGEGEAGTGRGLAEISTRGREAVLVVEDEPAILVLAQAMLRQMGYEVLAAGSAKEALEKARARDGNLDLLLTDVVMPGMNGKDLADRMAEMHPGMKRLFMSGYTAEVIAPKGVLGEEQFLLQKPFSMEDLGRAVRAALDRAATR